ncbi:MAG: hypothetical protein FWG90_08850 [Oscillospiraceae bacterium]|nr:hypothetical protein [Oscillospiraceae bacterium]
MKIKKILALLTTLCLMSASLAACTSNEPPAPPATPATAAEQSAEEFVDADLVDADLVEYVIEEVLEDDGDAQPTDDEVEGVYGAAVRAMGFFKYGDVPTTDETDDSGRLKVDLPGITSLNDFREYLLTIFSAEIVDGLLEGGLFADNNDGELYVMDAAIGGDITKGVETHEIIREDNGSITVRVTVEDLDPDTQEAVGTTDTDMVYENINGSWVFTRFELVR